MRGYRWNLLPPAPADFLASLKLPRLLVQLLYNRGLSGEAELEPFLTGDTRLCHDPLKLPDMEKAVLRIYRALLSGEVIAVYGDYDVDGITATAILVLGLTELGGKVIPYIPHRLTEGYGLNIPALEELRKQGVSLVITVDTGITAVSEVREAKGMGLDVIVTDHHTPLAEIPEATAVINPRRAGSEYPFSDLSGAGVAYKLLEAVFRASGRGKPPSELADLVALGTIADVTPLTGENRYLVKQGLKLMNAAPRLGLREMKVIAGLGVAPLDAEAISWVIAPRLNAAGRLAHAMDAYRLITTDSPEEAQELALKLEEMNCERQQLTARVLNGAREQILRDGISGLLMAGDSQYPAGITGLAASRLTEEFYRPVVLVSIGETVSSGSCRSIPEFNIIMALNECRHLLSRFGGHSQAAGFSLPTGNLKEFKETLSRMAAAEFSGKELYPSLDIDAEIKLSELGGGTFQLIKRLAPFGRGNAVPAFMSRKVRVVESRNMGSQREHLRLKLRQNGTVWDAVAFRQGDNPGDLPPYIDIVYNLEVDSWQGRENLRLNILDFRQTA